MELTVAKVDLQKELQLCQGVVEKRSTIPILSNVLLKAADGRLQIAATDLDVTILTSCAAKVTTPGGVTIELAQLGRPDRDHGMRRRVSVRSRQAIRGLGPARSERSPTSRGSRHEGGVPDGRRIGVGFATYCEQSAHGTSVFSAWGLPIIPGYDQATVRVTPDGGLEVRVTPHIGIIGDFSWNVLDGPHNNFGMARTGLTFAF